MAAGTHIASAISQPKSRSGSGPTGVQAGSTNISRVARCPAATISLSTPAKITATPSTNISPTLNQGCGATRVPSVMRMAPLNPSPQYASALAGRLPGKSTKISSATDPKMVNNGVCDPPATVKLTAAARGSTMAARSARRSASNSGSRARSRSNTCRNTAAVSVGKDLDPQDEYTDTDKQRDGERLLPPPQLSSVHGEQGDQAEFGDQHPRRSPYSGVGAQRA